MNVLVELTGAIDALCAAEPAHLADRQSIQDPASPARAAARGHHPGHGRLRGGRHLGGRRCPQRGGVAGDASPHGAADGTAAAAAGAGPAAHGPRRGGLAGGCDRRHPRRRPGPGAFAGEQGLLRARRGDAGRPGGGSEPPTLRPGAGLLVPAGRSRRHRGPRLGRVRRPPAAPVPEPGGHLGARRRLRPHRRRGAGPGAAAHRNGARRPRLGRGPGPGGRGGVRR